MPFCPKCGYAVQEGARFCSSCAADVSTVTAAKSSSSGAAAAPAPAQVVIVYPHRGGRLAFWGIVAALVLSFVASSNSKNLLMSTHDIAVVWGLTAALMLVVLLSWRRGERPVVGAGWAWCAIIFLFLGCFANLNSSHLGTAPPSSTASDTSSRSAGNGHEAEQVPSATSNWDYSSYTDQMTGKTVDLACTTAVTVDKGQFLCEDLYNNCLIQVKFDDGPMRRFDGLEPEDGSSNTVFFEGYSGLLAATRKAQHLKVQALFYQEGNQVMEFDVAGLEWKK